MFWSVNSYITNDWETAPRSGGLALPANWSLYFLTTIFHLSKSNQYLGFSTLILTVCEILNPINGLSWWLRGTVSVCSTRATREACWTLGHEDPLEEGMVTHVSFLAWRIPWTKVPTGLQSRISKSQTWLKRLCMHEHTHNKYLFF